MGFGVNKASTTLVSSLLFISTVLGLGCDPLIYRDGVVVKCESKNSRTAIDCYSSSVPIPVGTVATYGCDEPFYFSVHERPIVGRERKLVCNEKGIWSGGLSRFHLYSCAMSCGIPNLASITPFVQGGKIAKQRDWPWHATIFKREGAKNDYICGGSLVKPHGAAEFIIVTAAHCMVLHGAHPRNVTDVLVVLGSEESRVEDLKKHSPNAQLLHVREIVLHSSYNGGRTVYQGDIAILRLREPIRPQSNILPICLGELPLAPRVGIVGHISGFGLYDRDVLVHSNALRSASFPVVDPDLCSEWRSVRKLNSQEFCAGTATDQNACNGDSGGGMVFNGTDEYGVARLYLHGIVSHGRGGEAVCDSYTVYTKVSTYLQWIYDTVDKFEESDQKTGGPKVSNSTAVSCPEGPTSRITTETRNTLCVSPDAGTGTCPKNHRLYCRIIVYLPKPDPCDGGERCCVAS